MNISSSLIFYIFALLLMGGGLYYMLTLKSKNIQ